MPYYFRHWRKRISSVSTENEHFNYSANDSDPRPCSKVLQNELICHLCDSNHIFITFLYPDNVFWLENENTSSERLQIMLRSQRFKTLW